MTTPAPSPEPPPAEKRSLLGFYIATGVVVALLVAGYFAWTPLRVWYWEKEVRTRNWFPGTIAGWHRSGFVTRNGPPVEAARCLVAVGPPARGAVARLIEKDENGSRVSVVVALQDKKAPWAIPLLVAQLKKGAGSDRMFWEFMGAIHRQTGRVFSPPGVIWGESIEVKMRIMNQTEKTCLAWWEKEGKAKYGRAELKTHFAVRDGRREKAAPEEDKAKERSAK